MFLPVSLCRFCEIDLPLNLNKALFQNLSIDAFHATINCTVSKLPASELQLGSSAT